MIVATREELPNFGPDPGVNRTQIGAWYVEWTGTEPTLQEVEDFINPPQTIIVQGEKQIAKAQLVLPTPNERKYRAVVRLLLQMNNQIVNFLQANAATLPAGAMPNTRTWSQLLTALRNHIDSETDPNS